MRILVFDTETTGLSRSKFVTMRDIDNWPYIVQFSYLIYNTETQKMEKMVDHIIKVPPQIEISKENAEIHGITKEMTQELGTNILPVLRQFTEELAKVDLVAGHNIEFDLNMIKAEYYRFIKNCAFENEQKQYLQDVTNHRKFGKYYCTMQESIALCNIKATRKNGAEYVKFPKLSELHSHLYSGCVPNNLHNSLNDVIVCLRCFYKMKFGKEICDENDFIKSRLEPLCNF